MASRVLNRAVFADPDPAVFLYADPDTAAF